MRSTWVLAVAMAACWANGPSMSITNRTQPLATRELAGGYWCSIRDSGYTYPQFPCAIRQVAHRYVLAKLAGSQRFVGEVTPAGDGFTFVGQFYCPWGDCTQELHGAFRLAGGGALIGRFRDAQLIVRLVPAPDAAFGGAEYGGDGYGGFSYGGATYGYSGSRPLSGNLPRP